MTSYLGSKAASGAYQAIIAAMPPHDTYIETHLGSGAVARRKPPAVRSILMDRDDVVVESFASMSAGDGVDLRCGDAHEFLSTFDFASSGRCLVYADPPYLLSTRTSRHRYKFDYTEGGHRELLGLLRGAVSQGAAVMISGYPSELYMSMLPGWRSIEFQVMTRGGPRTECLWMSYPSAAMSAAFAGRNFTDRQRIKRKAGRWAVNYAALPPGERLAVLAAILGTHGQDA